MSTISAIPRLAMSVLRGQTSIHIGSHGPRTSIAQAGYALDIYALRTCDECVLVLPSGRSASWEFGYAMGQGKHGTVVQLGGMEPELMYSEASIVTSMEELCAAFSRRVG